MMPRQLTIFLRPRFRPDESSKSGARRFLPARSSYCVDRPQRHAWRKLLLAGDYTDTGLPATIEGAIGSGFTAARRALTPGIGGRRSSTAESGDIVTETNHQDRQRGNSVSFHEQRAINEQAAVATRSPSTPAGRPTGCWSDAISRAASLCWRCSIRDGHWVFELEADATIPAEYILLQHYLGRIEPELQARIAAVSTRRAKAGTAAGHCSTAARSISAVRSRRTSR